MFTLTHPDLVEALIQAHQRGVDVEVAIDYYTATFFNNPKLTPSGRNALDWLLTKEVIGRCGPFFIYRVR